MTKTIQIGDKEVQFKTSAAIPHIYRRKFGRDIFIDMDQLQSAIKKSADGSSSLSIDSLEMFENLAFCFARHADPTIPEDVEEWLEQFETFDIYNILPELFDMWIAESKTSSKLKKKNGQ